MRQRAVGVTLVVAGFEPVKAGQRDTCNLKLVEQTQAYNAGIIEVFPTALDQQIEVDDGFVVISRRFYIGSNDPFGIFEFILVNFLRIAIPYGIAKEQVILPIPLIRNVDANDDRIVIRDILLDIGSLLKNGFTGAKQQNFPTGGSGSQLRDRLVVVDNSVLIVDIFLFQ